MLSKSEVTDIKVFLMSHFSLTCDLALWLLIGQRSPIMRLGAFGYSKGLFWCGMLKPPSLCNVQKLALEGLKFTWSAIGSGSTKHITEKQICSEVRERVHFRLGKEVLTEQFSNHNSLLKRP